MSDTSSKRRQFLKVAGSLATISAVSPAWQKAHASAASGRDPFIEGLVERMTPEEKAGQLSLHGDVSRPGDSNANPQALALETDGLLKNIAAGEVSCLFNGIGVQGGHLLQSVAVRETVQLYIRDRVASPTRPVRELKNFSQIELAGGESREVSFELMREDLGFVNAQFKRVAEPGRFEVWIAPSSTTGIPAQFTLI